MMKFLNRRTTVAMNYWCLYMLVFWFLRENDAVINSRLWYTEKADPAYVAAGDKIEFATTSMARCAAVSSAATGADLVCYDGATCVIITAADLNSIRGRVSNWRCFLTGEIQHFNSSIKTMDYSTITHQVTFSGLIDFRYGITCL
jgi:hypothetical protein